MSSCGPKIQASQGAKSVPARNQRNAVFRESGNFSYHKTSRLYFAARQVGVIRQPHAALLPAVTLLLYRWALKHAAMAQVGR
jgi:hypothetical protein